EWIARLATEGELPRGFLIRARIVGAVYGTQQSVIDEVVDDHVVMSVVLLHQQDREYAQQAIDAVADAEAAVTALGRLAEDLARAAGSAPEPAWGAARDLGFAALDGPYRTWLRGLADAGDPYEQRRLWQREAYRHIGRLGEGLLAGAGDAAWEGRTVATKKGSLWLNSPLAELWFRSRLNKALSRPFGTDQCETGAVPETGPTPEPGSAAGSDFSSQVPA
ncbi:type I-E CRISPR-associated protein Cse1/CasA, partial [Streptomyces sp. 8N706]|uniref:type I-E CRISPR-associated protein Cse1/CasA n=1 Tax=Streptomyces sp. 8N706 TaxID=3457416 RepID=UPI003FD12CC2